MSKRKLEFLELFGTLSEIQHKSRKYLPQDKFCGRYFQKISLHFFWKSLFKNLFLFSQNHNFSLVEK
jgi:hypothetical protein